MSLSKLLVSVLIALCLLACTRDGVIADRPSPEERCASSTPADLAICVAEVRKNDEKEKEFLQQAARIGPSQDEIDDSRSFFEASRSRVARNAFSAFLIVAVLLAINFIPTFVAVNRKHRNKLPIFLLNLFLGWTLVGWVVALVWATLKDSGQEAG